MDVVVRPIENRRDRDRFLRVPWQIYADDPCWVPPLLMGVKKSLSSKNPFFEYGEAQLFLAERGGKPVGRISAQINKRHNELHQEKVGFFGFFESIDDF